MPTLVRIPAILSALVLGLVFLFPLGLKAQPELRPSATHAQVIILLRDFARQPIAKADVWIEDTQGRKLAQGKTDKGGVWQLLLPHGATYWIGVEDSARVEAISLEAKPYLVTRRTIHFQGTVNGKPTVVAAPHFNMMPPADGMARVDFTFIQPDRQPLVGETVTMIPLAEGQPVSGTTDGSGRLTLHVPIGQAYRVALKYLPELDKLDFPAHGGSYSVRLTYGYAGSAAIERARRQRIVNDSLHNAYRQLSLAEQRKLRDADMHKVEFRSVEVHKSQSPDPLARTDKPGGYLLSMPKRSAMTSPLAVGDLLIVGGGFENSVLYALDARTGELRWAVMLGEGGPSAPTAHDGVILVITESCTLYAIDAITGNLLWSKWLAGYVLSAPAVHDGRVYAVYEDKDGAELKAGKVAEANHALACFDLRSGAVRWQQWVEGEAMSAAVAHAGRVYLNTFHGMSYAFEAATGKLLASARLLGTSAPVPHGALLLMSQRNPIDAAPQERIAAFDAATLALKAASPWRSAAWLDPAQWGRSREAQAEAAMALGTGIIYQGNQDDSHSRLHATALIGTGTTPGMQLFSGSRPLVAGKVVVAAMGPVLVALSLPDLKPAWEFTLPGKAAATTRELGPPIFAGNRIYLGALDGVIRAIDPQSGRVQREWAMGEPVSTPPIAVGGWIFAGSRTGQLVAVDTGDPAVDGWDAWGGGCGRMNAAAQ